MDTQQSTEIAQRPARKASAARSTGPSVRTRQGVHALKSADDFRQLRGHVFPSENSLKWHIRVNRKRLVEAGALFLIAGKLLIEPKAYDRVLLEDGRALAEAGDE